MRLKIVVSAVRVRLSPSFIACLAEPFPRTLRRLSKTGRRASANGSVNGRPGDEKKTGGWKARSSWISELNEIRNSVSHSRGISEDAFALLVDLRSWLLLGEVDNEL